MDFDKSRIYAAFNADEVKIGSRGYFFDDLDSLLHAVNDNYEPHTVSCIRGTDYMGRFEDVENHVGSVLFYLVEEPEEKKLRPYNDTNEMIADFIKRRRAYGYFPSENNPLYNPMIWLKRKESGVIYQVSAFDEDTIYAVGWYSMKELLSCYTYTDGTPCGVEE